jgi:hypothetical protein
MRLLGAIAAIGLILGLLFGGLPHDPATQAGDRVAVFTVTRAGVDYRVTEPASAWDVQSDGRMLVRTPPDGGPTEYYATADDDRADATVTFSSEASAVTMHLVKLDTTDS